MKTAMDHAWQARDCCSADMSRPLPVMLTHGEQQSNDLPAKRSREKQVRAHSSQSHLHGMLTLLVAGGAGRQSTGLHSWW